MSPESAKIIFESHIKKTAIPRYKNETFLILRSETDKKIIHVYTYYIAGIDPSFYVLTQGIDAKEPESVTKHSELNVTELLRSVSYKISVLNSSEDGILFLKDAGLLEYRRCIDPAQDNAMPRMGLLHHHYYYYTHKEYENLSESTKTSKPKRKKK